MTQPYSFTTPLTPSTRMRLPRSGFVQTGLEEINDNLPEADFGTRITSGWLVTRRNHDGHRWRRAMPTDTSAMAELLVRAIHILGEDGLTISGEKFYGVYPARTP